MATIPQISEAEWRVMEVLWSRSRATAPEVIELLAPRNGWSPKTVRTLLDRLVKKGAAGYDAGGPLYTYFALVKREECAREESRSFLKRVHGGSLKLMLAHFLDEERLSREQIEELRRILDDRMKEDNDELV